MNKNNIHRIELIEEIFDDIHRLDEFHIKIPMFRWLNYKPMKYWYNAETDSMECECGVSIPFNVKDEDINYDVILDSLYALENKVMRVYKEKYNIELYNDY